MDEDKLYDLIARMTIKEQLTSSEESVSWNAYREAERISDETVYPILKKIIEETEATLPELLKDNNARLSVPSAHMRFGHEVVVMPTACFMNLNGAGTIYKNLDDLEKNKWYSYKIFPMASNIG